MNHTKEIRIINFIVLVMVILAAVLPSVFANRETSAVYIRPADFSDGSSTLEHRMRVQGEDVVSTFTTEISSEDLAGIPKTDLGLVITRMDGQGYKVWWNDRFIGQAGDPYKGCANIWNTSNVFLVEGNLLEEQNTLTIQTYALYEVGMYDNSIQITSWREAMQIERRYDLLSNDITLISLGMAIFAAITILVHTILHAHNKRKMLAIAAAMLCMALYGVDYLGVDYLTVPYLVYKKLVTTSLYFAVFSLSMAVGSTVKNKIPIIFSGILTAIYVVGELLIRDMITFKLFFNTMTVFVPINLLVWLIILLPMVRVKDEARIFFDMLSITVLVGLWEVFSLVLMPGELVASPFPMVIIAGALLTMFLALSSIERNRQLQTEIEMKDALYLRAISDAQTGIYNKPYFSRLLAEMTPPFTVAMFDIDNFKTLNDTCGHLIGDAGIMAVVQTVRENAGEEDILGRYGGDEFLAAFRTEPEQAEAKCEKIRQLIESGSISLENQDIRMTVSIGIYHVKKPKLADEILQKADIALYAAKAAGKNCTKVYRKKMQGQHF